jgi:hypothetical protein
MVTKYSFSTFVSFAFNFIFISAVVHRDATTVPVWFICSDCRTE